MVVGQLSYTVLCLVGGSLVVARTHGPDSDRYGHLMQVYSIEPFLQLSRRREQGKGRVGIVGGMPGLAQQSGVSTGGEVFHCTLGSV